MLELCKTRAKKSSPDMFNFYVVLAGHDLLSDAGTTTTCRRKTKPHDDEQKYKNEQSFEKKRF